MEKPYLEQIFKYVRTSKVSDLVQATSVGLVQNTNLALSSDRVYLSGYGMGSTFAAYVAFCFPGSVSGLVQAGGHGYKRKGDGVMLDDGAGECAECQYYPVKVLPALSLGRALKHCAFATMNDAISPPRSTVRCAPPSTPTATPPPCTWTPTPWATGDRLVFWPVPRCVCR